MLTKKGCFGEAAAAAGANDEQAFKPAWAG
jgi:hypothetical protein